MNTWNISHCTFQACLIYNGFRDYLGFNGYNKKCFLNLLMLSEEELTHYFTWIKNFHLGRVNYFIIINNNLTEILNHLDLFSNIAVINDISMDVLTHSYDVNGTRLWKTVCLLNKCMKLQQSIFPEFERCVTE